MSREELEEVVKIAVERALAATMPEHRYCQVFTEAERVAIKLMAGYYVNSTSFLWKSVIKGILALAALGTVAALSWKYLVDKLSP